MSGMNCEKPAKRDLARNRGGDRVTPPESRCKRAVRTAEQAKWIAKLRRELRAAQGSDPGDRVSAANEIDGLLTVKRQRSASRPTDKQAALLVALRRQAGAAQTAMPATRSDASAAIDRLLRLKTSPQQHDDRPASRSSLKTSHADEGVREA